MSFEKERLTSNSVFVLEVRRLPPGDDPKLTNSSDTIAWAFSRAFGDTAGGLVQSLGSSNICIGVTSSPLLTPPIHIPPLRNRGHDIYSIANEMITQFATKFNK